MVCETVNVQLQSQRVKLVAPFAMQFHVVLHQRPTAAHIVPWTAFTYFIPVDVAISLHCGLKPVVVS